MIEKQQVRGASLRDRVGAPTGLSHSTVSQAKPLADLRVDVGTDDATCFSVRNGWAWARIFVRSGEALCLDGSTRHWADISVISDYGSFGHHWSHMGEPWYEFIQGLDFGYAMQKFMGERFQVPMRIEDARAKVRRVVLEQRREGSMDADDARGLYDGANDCEEAATFLEDLDRASSGAMYRHELWDWKWTEPNPQARGFWDEIWPHFTAAVRDSVTEAAPAVETAQTGSIGDEGTGAPQSAIAQVPLSGEPS
jgi:hypothetical protein